MPQTKIISAPDGRQKQLTIPDGASPEDIQQAVNAVVQSFGPAPQPSLGARILRAAPATAGMLQGGAMGAEAAAPFAPLAGPLAPLVPAAGAVLGAGAGSGLAEGALALGQRFLRAPGGQESIPARMKGAAESGAAGEATGRILGPPMRFLGNRLLSRVSDSLAPEGITAAAEKMAGSRFGRFLLGGPARRESAAALDAVRTRLAAMGGPLSKEDFAENLQGTARRYLARVERDLGRLKEPPNWSPMERATQGPRFAEETAGWEAAADAERERIAPVLGSMRQIVGKTMSTAHIVAKMADDPQYFARVVQELGPESVQELQRAWLTGTLIDGTTNTARRGVLNTTRMVDRFEELGARGQELLFGDKVDAVRTLFDGLRSSRAAGALAGGKTPEPSKVVMHVLQRLVAGSTVGGAIGFARGGREGTLEGALVGAGAEGAAAAVPLIWGRVLVQDGGPEFLSALVSAAKDSQLLERSLPGLLRVGGQLVTRALESSTPLATPPTGTTTTTAPPTTTTTLPPTLLRPPTREPQTYGRPFAGGM